MGSKVSHDMSDSCQTLVPAKDAGEVQQNFGFASSCRCSSQSSCQSQDEFAPSLPPRAPRRWSSVASADTRNQRGCRIQPIIRNGRQVTNDFYWVLPHRKSGGNHHSVTGQYHNITECRHSDGRQDRRNCKSESDADAASKQLVARVREKVLGVTDEECFLALSLHGWSEEETVKYLKVEQLFRLGLIDKDCCLTALKTCQWDMLRAAALIVDSS